jgi:hypothetical protein
MDPVIIMVGRPRESVQDIEVMPDVPADDLADAIAAAFGWDGVYDIQINGKILDSSQTLAEVNAWDGSQLLLIMSNRPPKLKVPQKTAFGYRIIRVSSSQDHAYGGENLSWDKQKSVSDTDEERSEPTMVIRLPPVSNSGQKSTSFMQDE